MESVSTFIFEFSPSRMIDPSPNCLVMALIASSTFLRDSAETTGAPCAGAGGIGDAALEGEALDM